jgi:hypothetical protein
MIVGVAVGEALLDVATTLGPALLTLAGVWLGSRFARGREDRSWRRMQLVDGGRDFLRAAAAVEQWALSDQFAARLGTGQYPTDYKEDLEGLEAAVAVLSIATPPAVGARSSEAGEHLRDYVLASAKHQATKPKGDPMDSAAYAEDLSRWRAGNDAVEAARTRWRVTRAAFIDAARAELHALR